jgi:hypothetical protein
VSVWIRVSPEEGNAISTSAQLLAEKGYYDKAGELEHVAERWSRKQDRRWRVLSALRLERFA